jgi:hypothetical protein
MKGEKKMKEVFVLNQHFIEDASCLGCFDSIDKANEFVKANFDMNFISGLFTDFISDRIPEQEITFERSVRGWSTCLVLTKVELNSLTPVTDIMSN